MKDTKRIALLFDLSIGYCRDVLEGIHSYARNRDWSFHEAVAAVPVIMPLRSWEPDGVITYIADQEFAGEITALDIPCVHTSNVIEQIDLPLVDVDHQQVGEMAANFFLDRGYRRFGFFGNASTRYAHVREVGYAHRLAAKGFGCESFYGDYSISQNDTENWARCDELACQWLLQFHETPMPVGLFVSCDTTARYAMQACNKIGLHIPRDIAILAAGNNEFECRSTNPSLSSVEIPAKEIGKHAAGLLSRLMDGDSFHDANIQLDPVRVVTRESTEVTAVEDLEVKAFFDWLSNGFADALTTDEICERIGVGRRTLERKLSALLSTTIHREIRKRRIEEATKLLINTDSPITLVAQKSGFTSAERMAIVFSKELNMPPSQYRDKFTL